MALRNPLNRQPGGGVPSEPKEEAPVDRVYVLGGNASTLAVVASFRPVKNVITASLIPVAWTPIGAVLGESWQTVTFPLDEIAGWADQTFPPDDEHSFTASLRDIELLARVGWESKLPEKLTLKSVLNGEDLPEEIGEAFAHPAEPLIQCNACRRLCVREEFVWGERRLCAWDYHTTVFGKRGPWRQSIYEDRHFKTLPEPRYIAPPLLEEMKVEIVLALGVVPEAMSRTIVNMVIAGAPEKAHMAVRTDGGLSLLRERH